ncbi:Protein of unknown function [Alteromonadaceae bacterium Bs31]|nr:Protein of unknown function [Alteromonadaceae bacterium Bs31]
MNKWPSFDQLSKMAETHPDALEQFRQKEVDALIASAPEDIQRRLRGLQFQIDCQRRLHSSPISACVAISKMMHDSVSRLHHVLNGLTEESAPVETSAQADRGRVIPFPMAVS